VRKVIAVAVFSVLMVTTPAMTLAAPESGCTKTAVAFEKAREGSSQAPSGGFDNGAQQSSENSQVNFCNRPQP
jgi:hypothetical protein